MIEPKAKISGINSRPSTLNWCDTSSTRKYSEQLKAELIESIIASQWLIKPENTPNAAILASSMKVRRRESSLHSLATMPTSHILRIGLPSVPLFCMSSCSVDGPICEHMANSTITA